MSLGTFVRAEALTRLENEHFDVLVIGGGITGCGVALDAASRGLRVALVERDDFASGTSSKSSKMVHGGIRYLQQGEVRLVYEALAERHRLLRNAPHLVEVMPFLLPIFAKDGILPPKLSRAMGSAMWMYDLTGGARIGKIHKRVPVDEIEAMMPTLRSEHIAAAYLYFDARADDARLTLTLARTAALDFGATVVNHTPAVGLLRDRFGKAAGAVVHADGRDIEVKATVVVNAGGVWADEVLALDDADHVATLRPAKGVHITVPWSKVRNEVATIVPVRGDKRSVFVVRWGAHAYVGTTDTDYDGSLNDPICTEEDVDYLLGALNGALREPIDRSEITGTWAGLRPLVAGDGNERTADLSRKHSVRASGDGFITVTGGKLTTYRLMAEHTVDRVVEVVGRKLRCRTKRVKLHGTPRSDTRVQLRPAPILVDSDLGPEVVAHLVSRFGTDAATVAAMIDMNPDLGQPLVDGLPYLRAEAAFAASYEMAVTVDDVLSRRTRARLLDAQASADAAADVGELIAERVGLDRATADSQVAAYREMVLAEQVAGGIAPSLKADEATGAPA